MINAIEAAISAIRSADALLIGISNGLSIAEGYNIFADNESFRLTFASQREKYEIRSVLQGCFFPYPKEEARLNFMQTLVRTWIEDYRPTTEMLSLKALVSQKPYFILTTNADTHLQLSGFDDDAIWEIEGNFLQFVNNKSPLDKSSELNSFLTTYHRKRLVIMEIGIGSRNRIIKPLLMDIAYDEPNLKYIVMNLPQDIYLPADIAAKAVILPGNLSDTLNLLNHY